MLVRSNLNSAIVPLASFFRNFGLKVKDIVVAIRHWPWQHYAEKAFSGMLFLSVSAAQMIKQALILTGRILGRAVDLSKKVWSHRIKRDLPPSKGGSDNEENFDVASPSVPESVISQQIEKLLADRLPSLMRKLNQSCQMVEKDFFSLGEELQFLCQATDNLALIASEAVQHSDGQSPGVKLAEIVGNAKTLMRVLEQDHTIISKNLGHISTVVTRLKRLLDQSTTIKKLGKSLRMIGLNISIESARNLEAHDIFNDLANQIRDLSETVGVAGEEIRNDTESAQGNLFTLHGNMDNSLKHLKEVGASAERSMVQAVPEVEKVVDLSTDVLSQTQQQSEQISRQVGQIVMDIQLHDSISQRIEHVGLALIEAHVTLLSVCRQRDDAKTTEELIDAYSILLLQAAQVERVIHEIRDIYKTTVQAFDHIKTVVDSLLKSLESLRAGTGESGRAGLIGNNPLDVLKEIFARLNDLIEQGALEMGKADRVTNDSKATAERLSQHAKKIRDLNFDVHLKALNAIASSLRLGSKGRTIEVLVQDMKALAIQSNEYVVQLEAVIQEIIAEAGHMRGKSAANTVEKSVSNGSMDALLGTFMEVCARFETGVTKAFELGAELDQRIETVLSRLLFLNAFSDQFETSLEKLNQTISDLKPFVNEELMAKEDLHARLSQRYTTSQEREIHDRLFGGNDIRGGENTFPATNSHADSSGQEKTSEPEDELGDNVELF